MRLVEALGSIARSDIANGYLHVACGNGVCKKYEVPCNKFSKPDAAMALDRLRVLGLLGELERFLGEPADAGRLCHALADERLLGPCARGDAGRCSELFGKWMRRLRGAAAFFEELRDGVARYREIFEAAPAFSLSAVVRPGGDIAIGAVLRVSPLYGGNSVDVMVELGDGVENAWILVDCDRELWELVYGAVRDAVAGEAARLGAAVDVREAGGGAPSVKKTALVKLNGLGPGEAADVALKAFVSAFIAADGGLEHWFALSGRARRADRRVKA